VDHDNLADDPVGRRWWLLAKALESMPLAQALQLAQETESFLAGAQGDDIPATPPQDVTAGLGCPSGSSSFPPLTEFASANAGDRQVAEIIGHIAQSSRLAIPKEPSPREVAVLTQLIRGDSNKRIARNLGITEATVKVHLKSLMRKIGVTNRTQAAMWATSNGFTPASSLNDEISRDFSQDVTADRC
jgi:DNA-binding CsgD family transcriptional regulator